MMNAMRTISKLLAVSLIAVALAGCTTLERPTRTSPENGAIFGYFEIPRLFGYLQYLSIIGGGTGSKFYVGVPNDVPYIIRGGAFFAYNAKPGSYEIESLYTVGGGYFSASGSSYAAGRPQQFNLVGDMLGNRAYNERLKQESAFTVNPGELHYVGAKRIYIGRHGALPTNGTLSIGPAETPTERQVLEKLLPALKGTPWQQPAEVLLSSLR